MQRLSWQQQDHLEGEGEETGLFRLRWVVVQGLELLVFHSLEALPTVQQLKAYRSH